MNTFHFIRPLWLLCFFLLAIFLMLMKRKRQAQNKKNVVAEHLKPFLVIGEEKVRTLSPQVLLPIFVSVMIVIVAGPTWKPVDTVQSENTSPVIFIIDLSKSMTKTDVAPNRLEYTKIKLNALIESRADDLIGAWVYSGSGHLLLPPTQDRDVLNMYLSSLNHGLVPVAGKNISSVLSQLSEKNEHSIPGSIVVISDGIDASARYALSKFKAQNNHQIMFWKTGFSESMPMPRGINSLVMTADNQDINEIQKWIDNYRYFDPKNENISWHEFGYYLVFPALLLCLMWFRRGWRINWFGHSMSVILLLSVASNSLPSYADTSTSTRYENTNTCDSKLKRLFLNDDQLGQWFYQRGSYQCASQHFVDTEWKVRALMKSNQWDWALTLLNGMDDSTERNFNIALSYMHLQRFRSSERWFKQVLVIDPSHQQAQRNIMILDDIFSLMELRSKGQGTTGENMTADHVLSLEEDMEIEESKELTEHVNSADMMADEHLTKIWLEQVKSKPEVFLRNKFNLQLQYQLIRESELNREGSND